MTFSFHAKILKVEMQSENIEQPLFHFYLGWLDNRGKDFSKRKKIMWTKKRRNLTDK